MSCVLLSRSLGGVPLDVVVSEEHTSELEIAEHPVERGAKVSDHAWRTPHRVTVHAVVGGGRGAAQAALASLHRVQHSCEPFDVVTGLKLYDNMLIRSISPTLDKEHSQVLSFKAELQEVIIVDTSGGAGSGMGGLLGSVGAAGGAADLLGRVGDLNRGLAALHRGAVQARAVSLPKAALAAAAAMVG